MNSIRLVTYNLLSSHLSSPSTFPRNDIQFLDKRYRFKVVKDILYQLMTGHSYVQGDLVQTHSSSPIFLLQEVSLMWTEKLYPFFSSNKYNFIPFNYGNFKNGFMGVAIAFPTTMSFSDVVISPFPKVAWSPIKAEDDWARIKYNSKRWIAVRFNTNDKPFWVISCHLPCVHYRPELANTYTVLFLDSINKTVGNDPVIVGGDFNILSNSEAHNILITGKSDGLLLKREDYSPMTWPLAPLNPLKHLHFDGFTCHSFVIMPFSDSDKEPFKGAIDHFYYRWCGNITMEDLPQPSELLPNLTNPSDHIPLVANFSL